MTTHDEMFSSGNGGITTAVLLAVAHELDDFRHIRGKHRKPTEDEKDHEETAQRRLRKRIIFNNNDMT